MSRHLSASTWLPFGLVSLLVLGLVPSSSASGEHSAYGSTAGDPRVLADGAACFAAIADLPGTACAVLYGHVFNLLNKVPINVQRPPDDAVDLARGFAGAPGYEPLFDFNDLVLYSSPGFVEYGEPGGDPGLHNEIGITGDVAIDTRAPILGYVTLSADFDEVASFDEGPDAGVMPCLTVRMVLQTGRDAHVGKVLAEGTTTKTVVSLGGSEGGAPLVEDAPCPGDNSGDVVSPEDATEFNVTLVPTADDISIPAKDGFIIFIEWYSFAPGDPDESDKVYPQHYNLRTGADHLARVLLPIRDAVRIDSMLATPFDGKTYVQIAANSPWGSYDVDPSSIVLRVTDAQGNDVPLANAPLWRLDYSVDHDGHFLPVRATFAWDDRADGLAPGDYTLHAFAQNWQHTATAQASLPFTVTPDETLIVTGMPDPPAKPPEKTPMLGPAAPLLALALLGAILRKRHAP